MSITGFIILFAVIWFVTLWVMLPIGLRTQADEGTRVAGTMSGSPTNFKPGRTFRLTTIWAFGIWAVIVGTIVATDTRVQDIDPFKWVGASAKVETTK